MRPFLKWAGSKYRVINKILETLPNGKRLVEPFMGSGAVFLNADYPRYFLAERNLDLVNLYSILQREGNDFIDYSKTFFEKKNNTENKFYQFRALFNKTTDKHLKSALFIYLNRHGYNGLCRYNLRGQFNVPYGFYKNSYFPGKEMVHFYKKAKNATIRCYDFKKTLAYVREGDVVYCDPPYMPLSKTANFTQYGPYTFGENEQIELMQGAKRLAQKGIPVLISNHNTAFTKKIYQGADIQHLRVRRYISCKGNERNRVSEVMALFSDQQN